MNNIQIRLKTEKYEDVVQHVGDYIVNADSSFVFNHNLPDNNHYHIYLFETDIKPDSIRKKLARYYKKTSYAVSTTCGKKKKPIEPKGAYIYGTTEELLDPVHYTGYTETDMSLFKDIAVIYYNKSVETPLRTGDHIIVKEDHFITKADKTWEKLVENIDKYKEKTIKQIKSMIAAQWINEGKAIPRPSDCHRYAVSIHYRLKYFNKDWNFEVPEWALEGEYA